LRPLRRSDLKPFQETAAGQLAAMIQEFPSPRFRLKYDSDTGLPMPFLCRLRAITGAGKTPMLAVAAAHLKDGIILWTTNRGAVISQTLAKLRPGGSYSELVPDGTQVFIVSEMSDMDWIEMASKKSGLTILLATVAAFNQDGDQLRIHRERNGFKPWSSLAGVGEHPRQRPLYVFYDEGHGATERQFRKLMELVPTAFVLASASPLPDDLADLLPGKSRDDQSKELEKRTVLVPTKQVVKEGLLKSRLYFTDCDTAQADALKDAQDKWEEIAKKLASTGKVPIACFIVNDTVSGVDVWEQLVKLGVPKHRIAVHLNGARDVITDRRGSLSGLIDTYSGKRPEQRSPEVLRQEQYTHIIWNLTLREGWDEPLAYVGYIDDRGRGAIDIVQKIGRFVRQPDATPFDDPDLNAAYFYFNISDDEFETLLTKTQEEMETEGYEILGFSGGNQPPPSRMVEPKAEVTLQTILPWFGEDIDRLDAAMLDAVPLFADEALKAPGSTTTRVIDLGKVKEDRSKYARSQRASNETITPWDYLTSQLAAIDSRTVTDTGTIFSATLRDHPKMRQRMQYGSEAMRHLQAQVPTVVEKLNEAFCLVARKKRGLHTVKPFKLIAPDAHGNSDSSREKYKVRKYKNALHTEYNGLNPFEVSVADELDKLGKRWCRNPARGDGYRIPIPELGSSSVWFYPDFLLWVNKDVWVIDPKGEHLVNDAIVRKLMDLQSVDGLQTRMRVAFMVKGKGTVTSQGQYRNEGGAGYTLIRRQSSSIKAFHFLSLGDMVRDLVNA